MAASGPKEPSSQIGKALVDFSLRGAFPEEDASSLGLTPEVLPPAIEALTRAKFKLQVRTRPNYRISVFG
jgi:centromere/kinetochore protein ZW10